MRMKKNYKIQTVAKLTEERNAYKQKETERLSNLKGMEKKMKKTRTSRKTKKKLMKKSSFLKKNQVLRLPKKSQEERGEESYGST